MSDNCTLCGFFPLILAVPLCNVSFPPLIICSGEGHVTLCQQSKAVSFDVYYSDDCVLCSQGGWRTHTEKTKRKEGTQRCTMSSTSPSSHVWKVVETLVQCMLLLLNNWVSVHCFSKCNFTMRLASNMKILAHLAIWSGAQAKALQQFTSEINETCAHTQRTRLRNPKCTLQQCSRAVLMVGWN